MSAKAKTKASAPPSGNDHVLNDDSFTDLIVELDESIALVELLRDNNPEDFDRRTLKQAGWAIVRKLERARDILNGELEEASS